MTGGLVERKQHQGAVVRRGQLDMDRRADGDARNFDHANGKGGRGPLGKTRTRRVPAMSPTAPRTRRRRSRRRRTWPPGHLSGSSRRNARQRRRRRRRAATRSPAPNSRYPPAPICRRFRRPWGHRNRHSQIPSAALRFASADSGRDREKSCAKASCSADKAFVGNVFIADLQACGTKIVISQHSRRARPLPGLFNALHSVSDATAFNVLMPKRRRAVPPSKKV